MKDATKGAVAQAEPFLCDVWFTVLSITNLSHAEVRISNLSGVGFTVPSITNLCHDAEVHIPQTWVYFTVNYKFVSR